MDAVCKVGHEKGGKTTWKKTSEFWGSEGGGDALKIVTTGERLSRRPRFYMDRSAIW